MFEEHTGGLLAGVSYSIIFRLLQHKPILVRTDVVAIPNALKQQHQKVELCADIMFVQNIPFLTTIS